MLTFTNGHLKRKKEKKKTKYCQFYRKFHLMEWYSVFFTFCYKQHSSYSRFDTSFTFNTNISIHISKVEFKSLLSIPIFCFSRFLFFVSYPYILDSSLHSTMTQLWSWILKRCLSSVHYVAFHTIKQKHREKPSNISTFQCHHFGMITMFS